VADKELLEGVTDQMVDVINSAVDYLVDMMSSDQDDIILRRFRQQYSNLTVEQIVQVQEAFGHDDGEEKPCKVCKIMAEKEFALAED